MHHAPLTSHTMKHPRRSPRARVTWLFLSIAAGLVLANALLAAPQAAAPADKEPQAADRVHQEVKDDQTKPAEEPGKSDSPADANDTPGRVLAGRPDVPAENPSTAGLGGLFES